MTMVLPRGWVCPLLKGRDAPDSRIHLCLPGGQNNCLQASFLFSVRVIYC